MYSIFDALTAVLFMNPQFLAYDAVSSDENLPRRPIWELSSHFEHLENRSCGLNVTWQPFMLHIREQPLSRGASQSAVRRR